MHLGRFSFKPQKSHRRNLKDEEVTHQRGVVLVQLRTWKHHKIVMKSTKNRKIAP